MSLGSRDETRWLQSEAGPSGTSKSRGLDPTSAKFAAAMTGATTVSLLMTPFDVIKTRLQTQPPIECCQVSFETPSRPNPLTCITSEPQLAAEYYRGVGSIVPEGCAAPAKYTGIWGETISLGTFKRDNVLGGFWDEIASVRREAGIRGLWKGVGTTISMGIPSSAIYMLGYEALLSRISPYFTGSTDPRYNTSSLNRTNQTPTKLTPAPLIAGSLARTISATVISPIEMFRTRLQALPRNGLNPTYTTTFGDMGLLVRSKGVGVLWRGLGPTLWRDVPFSGLYWAGFELLKSTFATHTTIQHPLVTTFLSGAISGTISALLTQPFDVLKTRRQVYDPSSDAIGAKSVRTFSLASHVIKTEGWGALFAGLTARCGKVAPACGLMIVTYEGVGRWLGGKPREDEMGLKELE